MSTVLEKCSISNSLVKQLLKQGLFVPKKVVPVKKPLHSPSEEWFYQIADRFTPPLTQKERMFYLKKPEAFCRDLITGTTFLVKNCGVLSDAAAKVNNLPPEESIAALLAIQRILHASLDYNYLKFDRHLEYHNYKESPVGFYWNELHRLCLKAAKQTKVANPKKTAYQKMLELLSGHGIVIKSSKMKKVFEEAYKFMLKNLSNQKDIKDLKNVIKIFKQFQTVQEEEVVIFNQGIPPKKIGVVPTILQCWNILKSKIKANKNLVKATHQNQINRWFSQEDVPSILVAAREMVQIDSDLFVENVQKLYKAELRRWVR